MPDRLDPILPGDPGTYSYAQMMTAMPETPWLAKPGIGGAGSRGFQLQMGVAAISAAGDILNSQNQAAALKTSAAFQKFQATENIKRGQIQSDQAKEVEQAQLEASGSRTNQTVGAQRSSYAAQGVKVDAGSALDVQVQTGKLSAIDSMTIRNNAALKVWGIQTGSTQVAAQQEFEASAQEREAQQSLALGGAKAANQVITQLDTYESMKMRGW